MDTPNSFRKERKFILSQDEVLEFDCWMRESERFFYEPFPERKVCNIYFDNPLLEDFTDNLAGISRREKCRVRWYGAFFNNPGFFELKKRRQGLCRKESEPVSLSREDVCGDRLTETLREQLPPRFRTSLDRSFQVVLANHYVRRYFEDSSGLRLTLDHDMESANLLLEPFSEDTFLSADYAILEIKYPFDSKETFENFGLPFGLTRHSKYCSGLLATLP